MIRVVYEWAVEPDQIEAFRQAWQATTQGIHETVEGGRGSFLLQAVGRPGRILTIARWDSLAQWEAFWQGADPQQMSAMRQLGTRVSVTAFEEFSDFTV
ncbi:MAG: antibiotic biosynthesis monooxygenase [Rhodocyclaceae bacterium]|nr:antibiotic biosynthesis monooxygenase [Rhodocyclaceae bacterium]